MIHLRRSFDEGGQRQRLLARVLLVLLSLVDHDAYQRFRPRRPYQQRAPGRGISLRVWSILRQIFRVVLVRFLARIVHARVDQHLRKTIIRAESSLSVLPLRTNGR